MDITELHEQIDEIIKQLLKEHTDRKLEQSNSESQIKFRTAYDNKPNALMSYEDKEEWIAYSEKGNSCMIKKQFIESIELKQDD